MTFNSKAAAGAVSSTRKLIELETKRIEILHKLIAAIVCECGKNLGDADARSVFIAEKQAQLDGLGVKMSASGRASFGHKQGPLAERLWAEINSAKRIRDKADEKEDEHEDIHQIQPQGH